MDNQQATPREIGWLSGIFDGEGTVVLAIHEYRNKKVTATPQLRVTNTSDEVIVKFYKILEKLNIKFHIRQLGVDPSRLGKKPIVGITIYSLIECKKLLEIMLPDLTEKRARAELLIRWCEMRLKHSDKYNSPYTEEELEFIETWPRKVLRDSEQNTEK